MNACYLKVVLVVLGCLVASSYCCRPPKRRYIHHHYVDNVAIDKPAWQSSIYQKCLANFAFDGNTNQLWRAMSFAHTGRSSFVNFIAVDLLNHYHIDEVVVYNVNYKLRNAHVYANRLGNFQILAGSHLNGMKKCGHVKRNAKNGEVFRFQCKLDHVRYVKLVNRKAGNLVVSEIQVWGTKDHGDESILLSHRKPTAQSTTSGKLVSRNAVDGGLSGNLAKCASTKYQFSPLWYVDLKKAYHLDRVVIYNRVVSGDRLKGFEVVYKLSARHPWMVFNVFKDFPADRQVIVVEGENRATPLARYVGIRLRDITNVLTLCEVRVYGWHHHLDHHKKK